MSITVIRLDEGFRVICEDCGLHLCPISKSEGRWEARHPHPDDVDENDAPHVKKFYERCPNKGQVVMGTVD